MPRSRQASSCASCAAPGVAMRTASTSSALIASNGSSTTRAPAPAATSAARSAEKSLTTVTRAPLVLLVRLVTWYAPIMPTPSTAIRRSLVSFTMLLLVSCSGCGRSDLLGTELERADAAAGEERVRTTGDRQRDLRRTGVEVLLDDREDVAVQRVDGAQHLAQIGKAERRLDHHAESHRVGEREILGLYMGDHRRVDLLQVQVPDPLRVPGDQVDVVAAVVRHVAGVEAQVDVLGARRLEETLNVLLVSDVAVRV